MEVVVPPFPPSPASENEAVASCCDRIAWLLQDQDASPFRVRAWHQAATQIRERPRSVVEQYRSEGETSLIAIPHIGRSIAGAIGQYARTGRFPLLDSLEGTEDGLAILRCVPGLGPTLARRVHDELHIETLEELECAAQDGRLAALPGFGPRRMKAIRSELDSMLRHSRERPSDAPRPSAEILLEIDREYRERAEAGTLRTIVPRRMNPDRKAWLPIWHTDREDWHFTVLYSNSPAAHRIGKIRDWVVLFYEGPDAHGQVTVVTGTRGEEAGKRVIRG